MSDRHKEVDVISIVMDQVATSYHYILPFEASLVSSRTNNGYLR